MRSAVLSCSHETFALMVSWIVFQTEHAEHLRSRAVSRRFSVER
jgi:hypothetical protein